MATVASIRCMRAYAPHQACLGVVYFAHELQFVYPYTGGAMSQDVTPQGFVEWPATPREHPLTLHAAGASGTWEPCDEHGHRHPTNSSAEQIFVGRFWMRLEPGAAQTFRVDDAHGRLDVGMLPDRDIVKANALLDMRRNLRKALNIVDDMIRKSKW